MSQISLSLHYTARFLCCQLLDYCKLSFSQTLLLVGCRFCLFFVIDYELFIFSVNRSVPVTKKLYYYVS